MNLETALITIKTTEDGIETTRHYTKANMSLFDEATKCIEENGCHKCEKTCPFFEFNFKNRTCENCNFFRKVITIDNSEKCFCMKIFKERFNEYCFKTTKPTDYCTAYEAAK